MTILTEEQKNGNPLRVTRGDGVPLPDQRAAVREFMRQWDPTPGNDPKRDTFYDDVAPADRPLPTTESSQGEARELSDKELRKTIRGVRVSNAFFKPAAGIGDVHSDAKGSGARFNGGKPDLSLIPLTMLAGFFRDCRDAVLNSQSMEARAIAALECLGLYQSVQDTKYLFDALEHLGADGWEECANVFDYGKRKYAAWNWAKGMPWSVPLACGARHLVAMIGGEEIDEDKPGQPGSKLPHRGHVYCNVVMLLQYSRTYTEGNDLPAKGLL